MSYGGFCPKKVYRCPCLTNIIDQICQWEIRRLDDITRAVKDLHWGSNSKPTYLIRVDKNKETQCLYAKYT